MKRILIFIQFDGTNYSGWQIQENANTIQGELNKAIEKALGERVETFGSSRTDAGVHAYAMPVHFDTNTRILPQNIHKAINAYLPQDIKVLSSREVDDGFHARFNTKQKTYEYNFYMSDVTLPLLDRFSTKISGEFDFDKAQSVCKYFLGTHDFVGFCSTGNMTSTTIRTIFYMQLIRLSQNQFKLSVTGDGFLYNMVRIIAGTIIDVGKGRIDPNNIPNIIDSLDRRKAGKTASPRGLVLKEVSY